MTASLAQLIDGMQTIFFQAGGEWCYLRTPENFRVQKIPGIPCVIQCHGNRGYVRNGEADWLTETPKTIFVDMLLQAGIAVAGSHGTGNHWGRPSAVAANAALLNTLEGQPGLDKSRMGMLGGGLGGAVIWNAVTGPLAGRIRAVVLQQATLSYESVIRNHKFKDQLLEAYGIPADTSDDLAVDTLAYNDPLHRTRLLIAEKGTAAARLLPEVLFVHGDQDENMLYTENPVALSKVLETCGGRFTFQTYPGVGHATYQLGETAARVIADFFCQAFSLPKLPNA